MASERKVLKILLANELRNIQIFIYDNKKKFYENSFVFFSVRAIDNNS